MHTARRSWSNVRDVLVGIATHLFGQIPSITSVSAFRQTIWPLRVMDDVGYCFADICVMYSIACVLSLIPLWLMCCRCQQSCALYDNVAFTSICFAVQVVNCSCLVNMICVM